MEPKSITQPLPISYSGVPLLVLKAFAFAIALVVGVTFATNLIMDAMGYS